MRYLLLLLAACVAAEAVSPCANGKPGSQTGLFAVKLAPDAPSNVLERLAAAGAQPLGGGIFERSDKHTLPTGNPENNWGRFDEKLNKNGHLLNPKRPLTPTEVGSWCNENVALEGRLRGTEGVVSVQPLTTKRFSKRLTPQPQADASVQWHQDAVKCTDAFALGYTGQGITVMIVDDGVEHTNADFYPDPTGGGDSKVDLSISWDFNSNDPDPYPGAGDNHGTACAGTAAAYGNNGVCGSGSSPEARLGCARILGGGFTDVMVRDALQLSLNSTEIYSNSWGPYDDGLYYPREDPDGLTATAAVGLHNGITNGRNGLGAIYLWAGGNGRPEDNSNYDSFANSIYTIAVGAVEQAFDGTMRVAYFSEEGANIHVVVPGVAIETTDRTGGDGYTSGACTSFAGTSAATPLLAGIVALILEANPALTWRDVQHVLALTADRTSLSTDTEWTVNGADHYVHHDFGFGVAQAAPAIELAKKWVNVPPQLTLTFSGAGITMRQANTAYTSTVTVAEARKLEHVEVFVDIDSGRNPFGELELSITSPSGTKSILARSRTVGNQGGKMQHYFMTVHSWGESPVGEWTLTATLASVRKTFLLNSWQLIIYGTCPDGFYGQNCDQPCATLQNCGAVQCTTSDDEVCLKCSEGYDGPTCEHDCNSLLQGSQHCDLTQPLACPTGMSTTCAACLDGYDGPLCDQECVTLLAPDQHCDTTAPLSCADGSTTCAACVDSYKGPRCDRLCTVQGNCLGSVLNCDAEMQPTSCEACAPPYNDPDEGCNKTIAETCIVTYPTYVGDGWCDGEGYNNEACKYDAGDCCEATCDCDTNPWTNNPCYQQGCSSGETKTCIDPCVVNGVVVDCSSQTPPPCWKQPGACRNGQCYFTPEIEGASCGAGLVCNANQQCVPDCTPNCDGKICGQLDDVCGIMCTGGCEANHVCSAQGACVCSLTCSGTTPVLDITACTCSACQANVECATGDCDVSTGACCAPSTPYYYYGKCNKCSQTTCEPGWVFDTEDCSCKCDSHEDCPIDIDCNIVTGACCLSDAPYWHEATSTCEKCTELQKVDCAAKGSNWQFDPESCECTCMASCPAGSCGSNGCGGTCTCADLTDTCTNDVCVPQNAVPNGDAEGTGFWPSWVLKTTATGTPDFSPKDGVGYLEFGPGKYNWVSVSFPVLTNGPHYFYACMHVDHSASDKKSSKIEIVGIKPALVFHPSAGWECKWTTLTTISPPQDVQIKVSLGASTSYNNIDSVRLSTTPPPSASTGSGPSPGSLDTASEAGVIVVAVLIAVVATMFVIKRKCIAPKQRLAQLALAEGREASAEEEEEEAVELNVVDPSRDKNGRPLPEGWLMYLTSDGDDGIPYYVGPDGMSVWEIPTASQ